MSDAWGDFLGSFLVEEVNVSGVKKHIARHEVLRCLEVLDMEALLASDGFKAVHAEAHADCDPEPLKVFFDEALASTGPVPTQQVAPAQPLPTPPATAEHAPAQQPVPTRHPAPTSLAPEPEIIERFLLAARRVLPGLTSTARADDIEKHAGEWLAVREEAEKCADKVKAVLCEFWKLTTFLVLAEYLSSKLLTSVKAVHCAARMVQHLSKTNLADKVQMTLLAQGTCKMKTKEDATIYDLPKKAFTQPVKEKQAISVLRSLCTVYSKVLADRSAMPSTAPHLIASLGILDGTAGGLVARILAASPCTVVTNECGTPAACHLLRMVRESYSTFVKHALQQPAPRTLSYLKLIADELAKAPEEVRAEFSSSSFINHAVREFTLPRALGMVSGDKQSEDTTQRREQQAVHLRGLSQLLVEWPRELPQLEEVHQQMALAAVHAVKDPELACVFSTNLVKGLCAPPSKWLLENPKWRSVAKEAGRRLAQSITFLKDT